jgi:propionyl-CoA carboxylase alpha chain
LVELMIRVAAGQRLPLTQEDVHLKGWAIESRVYAEDPFRNFMPSIGRLVRYLPPPASDNVRVDTGVFEGGEVSMYYDPMIAKLITYGASRDQAIMHMRSALDQYFIRGVSHNISFLAALMAHPRFVEGRLSTNMIAEEYPDGFHASDVPHEDPARFITIAASINRRYRERAAKISGQMPGHERKVRNDWVVLLNGEQHPVQVYSVDGGHDIEFNQELFAVRSDWQFGQALFQGTFNGTEIWVQVERRNQAYRLFHGGSEVEVTVVTPRVAELHLHMPVKEPPDTSRYLLSPMPGLLVSISVEVGQEVKTGEEIAVIEAMKMENTLRAERDAKVIALHAKTGDAVAVDQPIVEFE